MFIKLLHQIVAICIFIKTHFFFYKGGTDSGKGVGYRVAFHGTVTIILQGTIIYTVLKTYISIDITEVNILKSREQN